MDVLSFLKKCLTTAGDCAKLQSKSLMAKKAITEVGPSLVDLCVSLREDKLRKQNEQAELDALNADGEAQQVTPVPFEESGDIV